MNTLKKPPIDISVIMPAINEEKNIAHAMDQTLKAFGHFDLNGEIIVINDGSVDSTAKVAQNFLQEHLNIRIINHKTRQGIGASFWDGVEQAQGNAVVMLPGDNENDPLEILRYYTLLSHVDIVVPFIFNRKVRPIYRNILSLIYRFIINTTFLVNFNYTNGTILYRKSILKELKKHSTGFFFQTDILIRAVKKSYLFAEVPYRLDTRQKGRSKALNFPSLLNVIKGYCDLIKDIYFNKNEQNRDFSKDSSTLSRRN